ncbi:LysR substrate-binding domain-containing protein [Mesorhizobium sp. L48C026A00]|uniref:LysR substrate-binding domain-containing protein n=1 Tax=Mesorhizobium sp. L48C026A00 TaxID=1287182 RepID=UPI0027B9D33B|nr:LysR substrate-binding domain-containing protein [Mesorhizobium sp. L48C026A00]
MGRRRRGLGPGRPQGNGRNPREWQAGGQRPACRAQRGTFGLGIALLPDAMTASHIRAGRLAHVLPELARKGGSLNLGYPSGRHQSAALRQLIEFVVMKMGA